MKRAWIELVIGFLLLAAAMLVWARVTKSSARAPRVDRKTLVAEVKSTLEHALSRASLSDEQKAQLERARGILREAAHARRAGQPVDQRRVNEAGAIMQSLLESGTFRPEDRRQIECGLESLREFDRVEQARERKSRREALIQQLGLPLGLLADLAVESL